MGQCASIKSKPNKKQDILITGLSGSGKSLVFFKLTGHPHLNRPVPTVGINSEVIFRRDTNFAVIEVGP